MPMILDIHSHKPAPYPEGVVSLLNPGEPLIDGQAYSIGLHPWDTADGISEEAWNALEQQAADPRVVAIGECGVDLTKGAPLFRQLLVFKRHIELSERLGKPLVIHCVKAADIILGLKRDLQPSQPWAIHGFRGKPQLGRQLTDKGIFLSFGEKFNGQALNEIPPQYILAETDDSILNITQVIEALSAAANRDLTELIAANTAAFLPKTPYAQV